MIRTIDVRTIEDVMAFVSDQQYKDKIDRLRSNYLYRGVPSVSYGLSTSLYRNCLDKQALLEPSILRYFSKYAIIEDCHIEESIWRQMIIGQHHGLPTRLLDWSHSPLVALHFASAEQNSDKIAKRDGVVWRIDAKEMSSLLPERYCDMLKRENTEYFSVQSLNALVKSAAEYDRDMAGSSMAIIEPPSTDQRIINQYAYFSVVPMGITDINDFLEKNTSHTVKYIIHKEIRWNIRDLLDQFNVSERTLFPGLDGLSDWIARHYYLK